NAKTSRPGVCNAAETVLVHQALAPRFLAELSRAGLSDACWPGFWPGLLWLVCCRREDDADFLH
ncbi:MAG: hypothetical protein B7Z73_08280, partial [Planctomycetia bacterium 21-64-5]